MVRFEVQQALLLSSVCARVLTLVRQRLAEPCKSRAWGLGQSHSEGVQEAKGFPVRPVLRTLHDYPWYDDTIDVDCTKATGFHKTGL